MDPEENGGQGEHPEESAARKAAASAREAASQGRERAGSLLDGLRAAWEGLRDTGRDMLDAGRQGAGEANERLWKQYDDKTKFRRRGKSRDD